MIFPQGSKYFIVTSPGAIKDDAAWTTNEIDTKGFRYLTILAIIGATDVDVAVWKLTHSDTSGSGHADITGMDTASVTTGDGRIPQDDDDDKIFAFFVDLKGLKRYIDLSATAGNGSSGTYMAALAILSRAEEWPNTTTERGLGGFKRLPA